MFRNVSLSKYGIEIERKGKILHIRFYAVYGQNFEKKTIKIFLGGIVNKSQATD